MLYRINKSISKEDNEHFAIVNKENYENYVDETDKKIYSNMNGEKYEIPAMIFAIVLILFGCILGFVILKFKWDFMIFLVFGGSSIVVGIILFIYMMKLMMTARKLITGDYELCIGKLTSKSIITKSRGQERSLVYHAVINDSVFTISLDVFEDFDENSDVLLFVIDNKFQFIKQI